MISPQEGNRQFKTIQEGAWQMKEELKALGLSDSDLENVSGGIIVAEAGNQKYWLVR